MIWIGLDIGGANLKLATSDGNNSRHLPFPLWQNPHGLADRLVTLIGSLPAKNLAVTMTGELCDCFESKAQGVRHIVSSVRQAFPEANLQFWTINQNWMNETEALANPIPLAAANWMAIGSIAAQQSSGGSGALIDMGSTTTDIVSFNHGKVTARGRDDTSRLELGELVYTGVRRTPLMALLGSSVCAEYFATIQDAYIWLGLAPEEPQNKTSADGRELTRQRSRTRLSRMMGGDDSTFPDTAIHRLATNAIAMQGMWISQAFGRLFASEYAAWPDSWIVSGEGESQLREWLQLWHPAIPVISFSNLIGPENSQNAGAFAVARLAANTLNP
jgi:(4-(4-[2-(gamma-L-glutamylamino)ethyl]phenoxymethyl)furan-2-yl)methanamine synthase